MAKVLFLQNIEYDYPSVMYISSVLKKNGHECDLIIENSSNKIVDYINKNKFDIFAFSLMSGVHFWGLETTKVLKEKFPEIPVIFGGVHSTYFPEVIDEGPVDIICQGEGEDAMLDLMNALDSGDDYSKIPNLWVKNGTSLQKNAIRNLKRELDEYPLPDRSIYFDKYPRLRNKRTKHFFTSRGCPYACSFCYNKRLKEMYSGKGKYIRYHSIERVIEEIKNVKANYPLQTVYFADDIFILDKKRAIKILDRYIEEKINLPFFCLVRANLIDEELVAKMSKAGCIGAWFGLESGNEKLREEVLKKSLSNEQIKKAADLLHRYGIKFRAYCMIGLPSETLENAFETIDLNIEIKTDFPWCSIFTPYSKTDIVDYALKHGYLNEESGSNLSGTYWKGSVLENKNKREILNLHRFFQTSILMPWTRPLVKKLIKLPPNPIFFLWFGMVYTYVYIKSEKHGFWDTMKFLLRYVPVFYKLK